MSFAFTIEALKFDKMKQRLFVRILFLVALGINLAFSLFPIGSDNFDALNYYVATVNENPMKYAMNPALLADLPKPISGANILYLVGYVVLQLINFSMMLFYAGGYSAERVGRSATEGLKRMVTALPKVFLILLLLVVPAVFSAFFFWIPLFIIACTICFVPFFYSEHKMKFWDAVTAGARVTKGRKLQIFIAFALLRFFSNVLFFVLPDNEGMLIWFVPLINVLMLLMRGRLLGLLYVFYYRQARSFGNTEYTSIELQDLFDEVLRPGPREAWDERKKDSGSFHKQG